MMLYKNTKAMVYSPDDDADFFDIVAGVSQSDISKLATVVEGDQKAHFSLPTTPRWRRGRYSFPWIAPLYPWHVPYIAEY